MDLLEIIKLIGISNISNAFGLEDNSFLILIVGSFIVGYTCLTFYYKIYHNNESWKNLDYPEKAIVSLVIGFLSILASLYLVMFYQYTFFKDTDLDQFFLQMRYISPFLYFITFSALASLPKLTSESMHTDLGFVKTYILVSFVFIASLNVILILTLLCINRNWGGIVSMILLILIPILSIWKSINSKF